MYTRSALLGNEKLKKNSHKPNLLSLDIWEFQGELKIEFAELDLAIEAYKRTPNIDNKNRIDMEVGDCINYLSGLVSKTDGNESLKRE